MQVEGVDREDIPIEHDEVRTLALLQAAGGVLLLQGEGGVDGIRIDGVLEADALFGQERLVGPAPRGA